MGKAKPAADEATVGKKLSDLVGMSRGADIEILGLSAQENIPDPSSHQISDVPVIVQPVKDLEGIGVDVLSGDVVVRPADYDRAKCGRRISSEVRHCHTLLFFPPPDVKDLGIQVHGFRSIDSIELVVIFRAFYCNWKGFTQFI